MPVKGRIVRISGPLVVAEGMQGAQMYEMVMVGEDKLIGEITRIRGDRAFIQVYESTTGVKPGEPVEGTGAPLSVWLGPGIIGNIYDGVQRPLPLIAQTIAVEAPHRRMFIERGIHVDSIPRSKKWHFKPGINGSKPELDAKVESGDVIGRVPETSLIEHRVMIPPGVRGRLKWIADEGDYTIEDTIAVVEQDGREVEVKMAHRWPVRIPRPYKAKLEPNLPLVTGIRIIDTFFPMAKGGTGAVPGGFGTGKCVPPYTPVLLSDGRLVEIEELYNKYAGVGVTVEKSEEEEIIDVSHLGLTVVSFDGERLVEKPVTHLYKGRSNYLVRIRTKSGRVIEVTPPHKLLKLGEDGRIVETPAYKLEVGDRLAMPRRIPVKASFQFLDPYELGLDNATIRDNEAKEKVKAEIRRLVEKHGSLKKLGEVLGVHPKTIESIMKGKNNPRLGLVKRIYEVSGGEPPKPRLLGLPKSKHTVKLPELIDDRLAELLGLIMFDGNIGARSVRFYNSSKKLRGRFASLIKELFGLSVKEKKLHTVRGVEVTSTLLVKILNALGIPSGRKSNGGRIPASILASPEPVIAAFLRGYYISGGAFGKNEVEIATASLEIARGLGYLLSRLGILYTVREKYMGSKIYYKIIITGRDELEKFYNVVKARWAEELATVKKLKEYVESRTQGWKTGDSKRLAPYLLEKAAGGVGLATLGRAGIKISNYTVIGERIGVEKPAVLASVTGDNTIKTTSSMLEYITIDEITDIEIIEGDFTVYDITVKDTHNFVGGNIPSILHNTVTLHSLAQWSDARVVVYIGCGERGNEMTEVLERFPEYKDPWTGKPLMERTILIANTSNMPVAAREASIYVGVTLAEYYRDMGYDVLLVADSTSRWAEALREIAGRLEEMPAEEGYPSYLASRLAEFYERAGRVEALGSPGRHGSVTVVGAVSPPGGDFTEPVTSHTKRFIRVFWALDTKLAYSRHYPAINWILSYSAYVDLVTGWWHENVDQRWREYRDQAMEILMREDELQDIVRLVGTESLDEKDKLVLEAARMLKDGFLKQNAFDPIDAFATPEKQFKLLQLFIDFYRRAQELVEHGIPASRIREAVGRLYVDMVKAKFNIPNDRIEELDKLKEKALKVLDELETRSG